MTAQITLSEQESRMLRAIAQQTGRTEDELLREAVEQYIRQFRQAHRRGLLQQARGMWQDRTDLPDLEALRGELDKY
jgi:predicted transcriptional regulator